METKTGFTAGRKFETPEEELEFLRAEVARREEKLGTAGEISPRDSVVAETVKTYAKEPHEAVLSPALALSKEQTEAIVLDLAPEAHDGKIEELAGLLQAKGIRNTLRVVEKMNDIHLEDDFHRFLIQYVKAGFPLAGLTERNSLFRSLHTTLYEVALPELTKEEAEKELKKLISGMEQFYAGMLSVSGGEKRAESSFSLEIANANGSNQFIFYVAVPDGKRSLFEKQVLSIFSNAKIREAKDDYNIFNESGVAVGSFARSAKNPVFPLKFYDEFDVDPLNVILNSFSKIDRDGEGAAIQFVLRPAPAVYIEKYRAALRKLEKGESVRRATDIKFTVLGEMMKGVKDLFTGGDTRERDRKKKNEDKPPVNELAVENVKKKTSSPLFLSSVRVIASAKDQASADEIISDIEAAFNQFGNTQGNQLRFKRLKGSGLKKFLREFAFRMFDEATAIPLNLKELTTMMHFPSSEIKSSPQLKQSKAGTAAVPVELPKEGILLGVNRFRNMETRVYMAREDRLRHFYAVGQTGTGKTTLLKNMIIQDIQNGDGVCMIDPHGVDIQDVLAAVPKERYEDVIYFDPSETSRPMALNMLEYDLRFPEQKTFVVNELFSIFQKLYGAVPESMGPMFEQYFRNAALLVIEDPETGSTLLDVSRVMAIKAYRDLKISRCKNPVVVQFWREIAERAGGEGALANMVPYITSKFDVFLANDIMRPIIAQEHSSFNFREIMDGKKILLVNLAKGRLGDINSHLIGLILVGKILMAALSRVDSYGRELPEFFLYIDEFQNVTTNSIATILSEARKYRLALTIAHQFIAQLEDEIKDAVFGNVGSIALFRVGAEDAEFLEKQFAPVFTGQDIVNLDNHNAYLKLLVNGRPTKPFSIETLPPLTGNRDVIGKLKELSFLKFGRLREEVEAEIMKKYQK